MSFKKRVYDILVGRQPPIRRRYVRYKEQGKSPAARAVYLFRLNFSYYILRDRELSRFGQSHSKPYCKGAESALSYREPPDRLAEQLSHFGVVSFDIFDTLIYRPFARPVDLFHVVGAETGLLNFAELRRFCEHSAREKRFAECGSYEVTFDDIYQYMEEYAGSSFAAAREKELSAELSLCFANPYMKRVWDILGERGVRRVVTSDMYLGREFLEELLRKNGYDGFETLFVSNEHNASKYHGELYEIVKKFLKTEKIAHVGDNPTSDIGIAKNHGLTPFHCSNPNTVGSVYRPTNMSRLVGSAYCGLVNARLHSGSENYSMLYEYGYAYSGIFTLGFCRYIHGIAERTGAGKVLFLARDGDLLKRVYDILYPDSTTEYFLWSRLAATKLCFEENTADFIRRFIYHKCGDGLTGETLLRQMDLSELAESCPMRETIVTDKNYKQLARFIYANRERISALYEPLNKGARKYLADKLNGCKRALAVDIGWAGSGGAAIAQLAEKWALNCDVIGVIGCANDSSTEQPDCSEGSLQSGRMYAYCYSQSHNRDIFLAHDAAQGHNIFFEMLLGSESPSLKGFNADGSPVFGTPEQGNCETVRQIHAGALDFVSDYTKHFADYPYMLDISGSDAYAPFGAAVKAGGKYFRAVLGECSFGVGVGTEESKINKQR
ncbi:MAG: HAD-IA family hydrolase [Oscillospiraceae bacterium]|nr:HAD-IA family hydrolase [Oscillospiraceae bacterium]